MNEMPMSRPNTLGSRWMQVTDNRHRKGNLRMIVRAEAA